MPKTWAQYLAAAQKLNTGGVAGNSMIAKSGDVSMFLVDWYTRFTTIGGKLMSGSPQRKNFTPRLTSPQPWPRSSTWWSASSTPRRACSRTTSPLGRRLRAGKTAMMLHLVDDRRARLQPEDVEGRERRRPWRSTAGVGAYGARRPRRLGHGHPEERQEQGRRLDDPHLPHLEGSGSGTRR